MIYILLYQQPVLLLKQKEMKLLKIGNLKKKILILVIILVVDILVMLLHNNGWIEILIFILDIQVLYDFHGLLVEIKYNNIV